jgi:hypothetical protein
MKSKQVTLAVNDAPIALNNFVKGYIDRVVSGIIASLKGTGAIQGVKLSIAGDQVSLVLNKEAVPLSPFVTQIIHNTIVGIITSLKKVSTVERIEITITR